MYKNRLTVAIQRRAEGAHHADQRNAPVDPYGLERREVVQGRSHLDGFARGECLVDGGRKGRIVDGAVLLDVSRLVRGSDVGFHSATVRLVFLRVAVYCGGMGAWQWGQRAGPHYRNGLSSACGCGRLHGRCYCTSCASPESESFSLEVGCIGPIPMPQWRIGKDSATYNKEVGPRGASESFLSFTVPSVPGTT